MVPLERAFPAICARIREIQCCWSLLLLADVLVALNVGAGKPRGPTLFFFPGCPDSAVSQGDAKASQCMFQNRGDSVGDFPEQILGSEKQTPSSPSALRLGVEAGGRLAWNALTRK